jgi:hypothetical protein
VGEKRISVEQAREGRPPLCEPASECHFSSEAARPVLAYRFWRLHESSYGLCGIHPLFPAPWRERTEVARCLAVQSTGRASQQPSVTSHDAPAWECTCGLSAFYAPLCVGFGITGVVAITGRTILHDGWLRAEKARVECFALGTQGTSAERDLIERLALEWDIPIVGPRHLGAFARSIGKEIPTIIRPAGRQRRERRPPR